MADLTIYTPKISTYGRIVSMCAEECGASWEIVPTDPRAEAHRKRHPFQKAPAVEIDGLQLYESFAICRYLDERTPDRDLQPATADGRARMTQWIGVADQYVFPATEFGLVLPRLVVPMMGGTPREDLIEKALPTIAYQLSVVEARLQEATYFAGDTFSLADIFMYCVWRAVSLTPEGQVMLASAPSITTWLNSVAARSSALATQWPGEPSGNSASKNRL